MSDENEIDPNLLKVMTEVRSNFLLLVDNSFSRRISNAVFYVNRDKDYEDYKIITSYVYPAKGEDYVEIEVRNPMNNTSYKEKIYDPSPAKKSHPAAALVGGLVLLIGLPLLADNRPREGK